MIFSILTLSCNLQEQYYSLENNSSNKKIEIKEELIKIKIDSLTIHDFSYQQFISTDSTADLIGYNHITHAFDQIDLIDKVVKRHINLEREGPNSIISMKGFYYYNEDSIFIFDGKYLSIIDSRSIVKSRYDLSNIPIRKGGKGNVYFLHSDYFSDLKYYPSRNAIFFRVVYNDRKLADGSIKRPLIAEYNLVKETVVNLLPVYGSSLFIDNVKDYGLHSSLNFSCGQDEIYFNFPAEANIYTIGLNNSSVAIHGGKSLYTKSIAKKIEPGEDYYFQYYKEELFFYPVFFPPDENYFIRLHWGKLSLRSNNNEFSLLSEKPLYLTIFDNDLDYIKELVLNNKDYYVGGVFCDKSAFYIFKNITSGTNSDEIELYRFNVKFEDK